VSLKNLAKLSKINGLQAANVAKSSASGPVLREYLIKDFAMNDELLKQAGGGNYFDELLA